MYYTNHTVLLGDACQSIPLPALCQLEYLAGRVVLSGDEYEERVMELYEYLRAENQRKLHLHVKAYRNDHYTFVRVYNDDLVDVFIAISTGEEEDIPQ